MKRLLTGVLLTVWTLFAAADGTFEDGLIAYEEARTSNELNHDGYARAYGIWKPLADAGHAGARYHIGMLMFFGLGGVAIDQPAAFAMMREAAEDGYLTAQAFMGFMYELVGGDYVVFDQDQARQWYLKAAESGHCQAIRRIARAYEKGELGLAVDADEARAWQARQPACRIR